MAKPTHKMEWRNGAWEWRRTSDGALEEPRRSQNPLQHGDRAMVRLGARPKKGDLRPDPIVRDLRAKDAARSAAAKQARRERFAALERDIDAGRIRVDPEARVGAPVVRVQEGDRLHLVPAHKLTSEEKARAERQMEAERERLNPAPAPEPEHIPSDVRALRPLPDAPGVHYHVSTSEGHTPDSPAPRPKPGAPKQFFESLDLSDLRRLPPGMKGQGLS